MSVREQFTSIHDCASVQWGGRVITLTSFRQEHPQGINRAQTHVAPAMAGQMTYHYKKKKGWEHLTSLKLLPQSARALLAFYNILCGALPSPVTAAGMCARARHAAVHPYSLFSLIPLNQSGGGRRKIKTARLQKKDLLLPPCAALRRDLSASF